MKKVPLEIYSRIVGYFRPLNNWNNGKKEEFKDRVEYVEEKSLTGKFSSSLVEGIAKEEIKEVNNNTAIKSYKLFTLPSCDKCESAKKHLKTLKIAGDIFDLASKDDINVFRGYYKSLKNKIERNEDGSLPVPTVLFFDEDEKVVEVAHNVESIKKIT